MALLAGTDSILNAVMSSMRPENPMLLQHAVIGLLRNLSIPAPNKDVLGDAGIIEKLRAMNVWTRERDLAGSVQVGAIGVVKNLCRSNGE